MSAPESDSDLEALAVGEIDDRDLRTLDEVAALYDELDPVPPGLVDRIRFGMTLDALHAEIAELQRSADLVGVRAADATSQTVTFNSSTLTTMVTITPTLADRVRVDGWVVPGAGIIVELRLPDESRRAVADEDGRFVFDDVPRGFAQFVLRRPDASEQSRVITPSIEL